MSKHRFPSPASIIKLGCPSLIKIAVFFSFSSPQCVLQETNDKNGLHKKVKHGAKTPWTKRDKPSSEKLRENALITKKLLTAAWFPWKTNTSSKLFLFSPFLCWSHLIIKAVSSPHPMDCHLLLKTSPLSANLRACHFEPFRGLSLFGC